MGEIDIYCMKVAHKKSQSGSSKADKLMKQLGDLINCGAGKVEIDKQKQKIEENRAEGKKELYADSMNRALTRESHSGGTGGSDYANKSLDQLKEMLEKAREVGKINEDNRSWGCVKVEEQIQTVKSRLGDGDDPYQYDKREAYIQGKKVNRALRKKVAQQEDYEKRHRSGTIDMEEVHRQIGQVGRIYKETVFERDNDFSRGGKWAIEVLVDCSGSMGRGDKMSEAKQAIATLGYALDKLPNLQYALTGFEYFGSPTEIQIKTFRDKKFNIRRVDSLAPGGGNADGYNIRAATNRLLKFKGMKKVLVVISDGQPAYENGIDHTKESVALAKRYGIEVIGIGIEGCTKKALEHIYPNNHYFENTKDLYLKLTNLILTALGQKKKTHLVKRKW